MLTSSWSRDVCAGALGWGDVHVATQDFVHRGGLADCLAGFQGTQIHPGESAEALPVAL